MDNENTETQTPDTGRSLDFFYENKPVRTVKDDDGEVWFVAADVCRILEHSDTSMAVRPLDPDEKGTSQICTPGGNQDMLTVNESGLYSLVFTSILPKAREFRRWVTHEVLPQIRKTGSYEAEQIRRDSQALPHGNQVSVILPCPGVFLVDAKRSGAHVIHTADDDKIDFQCFCYSLDHLAYAIKSVHALWSQLRLRVPSLHTPAEAARGGLLDAAIEHAARSAAHYRHDCYAHYSDPLN